MKYRRKPIIVDAVKMLSCGFAETPEWVTKALSENIIYYSNVDGTNYIKDGFIVQTLDGNMIGNIGDYLIRGVDGEIYPCKGDIFRKTYELMEEDV